MYSHEIAFFNQSNYYISGKKRFPDQLCPGFYEPPYPPLLATAS